jgi:hypothetical protein
MLEERAYKMVNQVSIPFTEGHYCGNGGKANKRKTQQMNNIFNYNDGDDNSTFR